MKRDKINDYPGAPAPAMSAVITGIVESASMVEVAAAE